MRHAKDEHPTLDELVELAHREELPADDPGEGLAHVRACRECEELFVPMRLLVVGGRARRQRRRRRRLLLGGAAGGVVFLALGLVAMPAIRGLSGVPGTEVVPNGSLDPPAAAPPMDADADVSSLADRGPVPRSLVEFRLDLLQGVPVSDATYRIDLRRGWEALRDADYPAAISTFEALLRDRPADLEAAGMLGVASYLAGDDSERTETLLRRGAEHRPDLRQRLAIWYLANLHLRRGEADRGVATLRRLRLEDGLNDRMSRQADDLLERIAALRNPESPGC